MLRELGYVVIVVGLFGVYGVVKFVMDVVWLVGWVMGRLF